MNKDRVEGKAKDVAGRVERQAGEWTDDPKMQVRGAAKQVEGKVQNAVGQMKDASKDAINKHKEEENEERKNEIETSHAAGSGHRR
ncbi:MAG: CsbD family protein [Terriglobales bacterium]|jgi:uncharacterized protein YjbJ (UPF0337 family)